MSFLRTGKNVEDKNWLLGREVRDSPFSSQTNASSSTPDYYMFEALGEVISSAAVIRTQFVSRTTPSTTEESVRNLRAQNSAPADHIGQVRLPLSFSLTDVVQFVGSRNSKVDASDPPTDMVHTPWFTVME